MIKREVKGNSLSMGEGVEGSFNPGDFQARLSCVCRNNKERRAREKWREKTSREGKRAEWREGGRIEVGRHRLYIVHKLSI